MTLAGGEALALTTDSIHVVGRLDAVILGGGQDIFPMLFEDTPKQGYVYDRARDAMEISLANAAIAKNVPVLGICRGAQLLNVAYGGSLHLDLKGAFDDADYPDSLYSKIFFRKRIKTTPGSLIRIALREKETNVNSLHKQAVKRLGEHLTATAVEPNGIIQAIEDPRRAFVLGVQFHPEFMLHRAMFRRIFRSLVDATGEAALDAAAISAIGREVAASNAKAAA